jgi:hypothetical protein
MCTTDHTCPFVPLQATYYALRPEVIESLYYLHQITGNPVYREWGWKIFTAIETCVCPWPSLLWLRLNQSVL